MKETGQGNVIWIWVALEEDLLCWETVRVKQN